MAAGSGAGSLPRNSFSARALMTGRWSVLRAGGVFTGGGSVQGEARTGLLPWLKIPTSKRQCHLGGVANFRGNNLPHSAL
jgi:hypothetical protein